MFSIILDKYPTQISVCAYNIGTSVEAFAVTVIVILVECVQIMQKVSMALHPFTSLIGKIALYLNN